LKTAQDRIRTQYVINSQSQGIEEKGAIDMTSTLKGKRILLGVCGSIACYKSAQLVRMWIREGASVKVIFSPGASAFITPLTFASLTGEPVMSDFTEDRDKGEWNRHVDLALWADIIVIAPLTANTIHKMACGECDSFLMAVYMSARCKVLLAPAMDHDMFLHPATLENLSKLQLAKAEWRSPKRFFSEQKSCSIQPQSCRERNSS
jgi:phosphopantothenoylcysteine decarboxylase/phosphopantothenate--cysteine ligase